MEKRTIVAIVGLVAVSICAFWVNRAPDRKEMPTTKPMPSLQIKAGTIASLEISQPLGKERVVFIKKGEMWQMTSPLSKSAEQGLVKSALESLEKLQFGSMTSNQKNQFADLEVSDDKAIHVVAKDAASNTVADLYVGKTINPYTMVRVAGKDEVWKTTGVSGNPFKREVKDWRAHALFDIKSDHIQKMVLEAGEHVATLERIPVIEDGHDNQSIHDARWKLIPSDPSGVLQSVAGDSLDMEFINRVASGIVSLRGDDFDDISSQEHVKELGFGAPMFRAKIFFTEGRSVEFLVGSLKDGKYFVKTSDSAQIFLIQKERIDHLIYPPKNILDKTLVALKLDQLKKITISQGKDAFVLKRTDKRFFSEQVREMDEKKEKELENLLQKLEGLRFVEKNDPALLSLEKPRATIRIELDKGSPLVLLVGDTKENELIVQKVGQKDAVWIRPRMLGALLQKPGEWESTYNPKVGAQTAAPLGAITQTERLLKQKDSMWSTKIEIL